MNKNEFYNKGLEKSCKLFKEIITKDEPYYIHRIGGIDWETIVDIYNNNGVVTPLIINKSTIYSYTGYYDLTNNKIKNFKLYYDEYIKSIKASVFVTVGNSKTLSDLGLLFNTKKQKYKIVDDLISNYCRYCFIEDTISKFGFLYSCGSLFKDKKVLLVSPFGNVMKKQYDEKRDLLFSTDHPLVVKELDYVNTYITINDNNFNPNLMHNTFLESLDAIKEKIKNKNFDVAFLSCGAYAPLLGLYIKEELKKQSIYIGGIMQIYFGIRGRRYFAYTDIKMNDNWINAPTEILCDELKLKMNKGPLEAIGAYF
jgi:hypothetical protein